MADEKLRGTYNIVHPVLGQLRLGMRGIYGISTTTNWVNRKCPLCNGVKKITLKGEEYTCPKCKGASTGEHWYSLTKYSFNEYFLKRIVLESSNYPRDIKSALPEEAPTSQCGYGELRISLDNVDYNKRVYKTDMTIENFDKYLITEESQVDNLLAHISNYYFVDEKLCKKVQRLLNKRERERVAKYVEEAKRLKEETTTTEFKF